MVSRYNSIVSQNNSMVLGTRYSLMVSGVQFDGFSEQFDGFSVQFDGLFYELECIGELRNSTWVKGLRG